MPTYKNNRDTVLRLQTRFNPRSTVPRELEVKPGRHFITHSSEVPASWLVQDGDAPPPVTLISPSPTDNELFC
jgi:hypothetical protein